MKTITEVIKDESAYLLVIGDLHLEDPFFTEKSEKKIRGYVDWVKKHPNARVFLNGDIFNVATRKSVTSPFGVNPRVANYESEYDYALDIFGPIRNQIIGANDGNHEQRTIDFSNDSKTLTLCKLLSTPERKVIYTQDSCVLFLKVGKSRKRGEDRSAQTYSGFIQHSVGGGSTPGGKLNRANVMRSVVAGCDFYVANHNHLEATAKARVFMPNVAKCTLTEVRQIIITAGGFLDYGGYVERAQMPPTDLGTPRLRFDGKKKDIHISL